MLKKSVVLGMAVLTLVVPIMAQETEIDYMQDYNQGKLDGQRDAGGGNPLWFLAGLSGTGCCLLIGVAGIGLAYLWPQNPPQERLIGKSPAYVLGYTEGYRNARRKENVKYATYGCITAALINLTVNLILGYPTTGYPSYE